MIDIDNSTEFEINISTIEKITNQLDYQLNLNNNV